MNWQAVNAILWLIWVCAILSGLYDFFTTIRKNGDYFPDGFRVIARQSILYVLWMMLFFVVVIVKPYEEWSPWIARPWFVSTVLWAAFIRIRWYRWRRYSVDKVYDGVAAALPPEDGE